MAKSRKHYYLNSDISSNIFSQDATVEFGFDSNVIMIINDSLHILQFSFNGRDLHGEIFLIDKFISMDNIHESKVWFKSNSLFKSNFRIIAWI